jgi:hypothetical protein
MISVCILVKASMKRGGKSSMASASFLSRLCPASCRKMGGVWMLILMDFQARSLGSLSTHPIEPFNALI